jgi:2-polyprenyl-3-methyl-5-hydroxy-6-metoxy-1,4-benzoquinol methylase
MILMTTGREEQLRQSWEANAQAWTSAVREHRIPSRNAGTDQAIVSILAALPKGRLLDIGCGEGWLSRAATDQGWQVVGVDASAGLIERAREHTGTEYYLLRYDDIKHEPSVRRPFDCIVCNFALLGEEIQPLLTSLRRLLTSHGSLVIQTVHPWTASGDQHYQDGWREETFEGWEGGFTAVMPWFFRTLASWFSELASAGFHVVKLQEPADRASGRPLSLLLVCTAVKTPTSIRIESACPEPSCSE